ncbi:dihydropteroate synthase [Mesorhizobium sp.]|uniref:dihydropteroate synthase n=1 Tax=Mesorhizobium sp. TaxID=1871066 RepID=UPI000FE2CA78|nr:dihydropteroate synthase [Mesorhizobium sp.]RWC01395.1 MAG: dihydropteroate synthase [Mesorhizobium sp.]RWP69908.1 MAG: dihydropteroate synthase [Mesorhizobium sp.]RWQ22590.1 MAG: dihydropteroate synthase [Mesorhizobium sp.]
MTRWQLAHGRYLDLGAQSLLMGILNVTPDSFSDGGEFDRPERALQQARLMIGEGAAIIDVGGESTRPGAAAVSAREEQARILPVIDALSSEGGSLVSVDTYRAETARLAVAAGAHIVNDVHGLQREPDIAQVAAETGAGLVIMHTGRDREKLADVIADQFLFLNRSLEIARDAGIADERIVLDPGFAFAKDGEENLELMARFGELRALGFPLLVGTSRKRLARHLVGGSDEGRDVGTAATSVILRLKGASIFRVHNVAVNRDALAFADAVRERETGEEIRRAR